MVKSSTVGVRELRQNLSVYLARVKRGERLTVTERRQIVAVLAPMDEADDPLGQLVVSGRATGAVRPANERPRPLASRGGESLGSILREQGSDVV